MRLRLSYSGTNIDFNPGLGFDRPDLPDRVMPRALDGTEKYYGFYTKKRWEVPIVKMSSTNAETRINTWWENGYQCTFYPDYQTSPSTSYTVRISNDTRPLWHHIAGHWDTDYSGVLILTEV